MVDEHERLRRPGERRLQRPRHGGPGPSQRQPVRHRGRERRLLQPGPGTGCRRHAARPAPGCGSPATTSRAARCAAGPRTCPGSASCRTAAKPRPIQHSRPVRRSGGARADRRLAPAPDGHPGRGRDGRLGPCRDGHLAPAGAAACSPPATAAACRAAASRASRCAFHSGWAPTQYTRPSHRPRAASITIGTTISTAFVPVMSSTPLREGGLGAPGGIPAGTPSVVLVPSSPPGPEPTYGGPVPERGTFGPVPRRDHPDRCGAGGSYYGSRTPDVLGPGFSAPRH